MGKGELVAERLERARAALVERESATGADAVMGEALLALSAGARWLRFEASERAEVNAWRALVASLETSGRADRDDARRTLARVDAQLWEEVARRERAEVERDEARAALERVVPERAALVERAESLAREVVGLERALEAALESRARLLRAVGEACAQLEAADDHVPVAHPAEGYLQEAERLLGEGARGAAELAREPKLRALVRAFVERWSEPLDRVGGVAVDMFAREGVAFVLAAREVVDG